MSGLTFLSFDVASVIVNDYLELEDAVALSLTCRWGRLAAHNFKHVLERARSLPWTTGAWPRVKVENLVMEKLPATERDLEWLTLAVSSEQVAFLQIQLQDNWASWLECLLQNTKDIPKLSINSAGSLKSIEQLGSLTTSTFIAVLD